MESTQAEPTKRCPLCGEQILAVAIKCKHCGSMLANPPEGSPQAATASTLSQPSTPAPHPANPLGEVIGQAVAGVVTAPAANWRAALTVAGGTLPFSIALMMFGASADLDVRFFVVGILTSLAFCGLFGGAAGVLLRVAHPHLLRADKVLAGAIGLGAGYAWVLYLVHQGALETSRWWSGPQKVFGLAMSFLGAANGLRLGLKHLGSPAGPRASITGAGPNTSPGKVDAPAVSSQDSALPAQPAAPSEPSEVPDRRKWYPILGVLLAAGIGLGAAVYSSRVQRETEKGLACAKIEMDACKKAQRPECRDMSRLSATDRLFLDCKECRPVDPKLCLENRRILFGEE